MILTPRGLLFQGQRIPCTIGRGGLTAAKREGDGATPLGVHHVVEMYYRADRLPRPTYWAQAIGPRDLWCDAPDHALYNQKVQAPFSESHEVMRRADPLYDVVLVLDWNYPEAKQHHGSAIFMHEWRGACRTTEGCVAMARPHLHWLARHVSFGSRLIIR